MRPKPNRNGDGGDRHEAEAELERLVDEEAEALAVAPRPSSVEAPAAEAGEEITELLDRVALRLRGHADRAALLERLLGRLRDPAPETAPAAEAGQPRPEA
jgi:hypothetical protein